MGLRIALTHAFCWPEVRRGGERYLHELAGAMSRRGHDVTIVAGARRPGVQRDGEGPRIIRVPRGRADDPATAERRFGMLVGPVLRAGRYDIVHSLGLRDAVAALRAAGADGHPRTVYTCLGAPILDWVRRRPDFPAHLRVINGVDVYGCLSAYAQCCLQEGFGRRGALTPGGVDVERFRVTVPRASEPTLLYSGALDVPRKGVAELLEAVAILARDVPRVRLLLSGPGDAAALLRAAPPAARERTEVLSLGTIDDQPARYASAWATVYPTRFEAFGLVLVESLAAGTPVVATDHGALPELVEPGAGALAPVGDPAKLAAACAEALELSQAHDARERCIEAAKRHDWDACVAPAIEQLYISRREDAGYVG